MDDLNRSVMDRGSDDRETPVKDGGAGTATLNDDEKRREEKVRENLRAEFERKSKKSEETVSTLVSQVQSLQDELKSLKSAPVKDKETKQEIKNVEDQIQDLYRSIKKHPEFPAWELAIDEIVNKRLAEYDYKNALTMVEELAEAQGYETENFKKEIFKILDGNRWGEKYPQQRLKLAFKEWKKVKDSDDKAKKLEEEEKKRVETEDRKKKEFQEQSSNRQTRRSSVRDDIKQARETGEFGSVLSRIFDKKPEK